MSKVSIIRRKVSPLTGQVERIEIVRDLPSSHSDDRSVSEREHRSASPRLRSEGKVTDSSLPTTKGVEHGNQDNQEKD